jgi:two-component system, chemotaxis family, sensor kinase CheA
VNDSDEEIVLAFLEESRENLDQLDLGLIALEVNPSDPELLAQVFRTIHTIKGTCGFLGFHHLEALSHSGENLLGAVRNGELRLDGAITTSLLALVDAIRRILDLIETTGTEGDDDHAAVVAALDRHLAAPVAVVAEVEVEVEPDASAQLATEGNTATLSETSVRVDVAILDKLMNLVGELVLTRSQFGESATTDDDGPLALPYRQLRLVTSELQEGVMRARLQPVGTVTGKFRRIVRDLASTMGKQIKFKIEGEDIGVDKAVNEALRDPLLHLVRNAVDHGIELPDERRAAGKPTQGTLTLRAFHEGGRVHIELADDGRGIDCARLVESAVAAGMLTADDAAALSSDAAMQLMFRPGLSTKDEITNISGRGVGLDVVRNALEQVGGSIDVTSELGRGSVFHLNVPLTLAIMPVLIASVGGQRYAVPQVDVEEIVYIAADEMDRTLHDLDGALIYRLRDRLLPLVDLAAQLHLESNRKADGLIVIVVQSAGRRFGIVVDSIGDTTEVVVKPLTLATRSIRCFGGVTLLSDGEPALILDVGGVALTAGVGVTRHDAEDRHVEPQEQTTTASLLLASDAYGSRLAVDMSSVRRLEQISSESVERSGPIEVVQYRGGILPIVRVADWLPNGNVATATKRDGDVLHAVVCESSIGLVGIVVGRIDDVVPRPSTVATPQPPSRRGVIASLVVDDHVTELLDVELLIADAGVWSTA